MDIDSIRHKIPPQEDFDNIYEPERKKRPFSVVFIGLMVVGGLIYLSGIYQANIFSRTPVGIPQEQTESFLDADTIILQLNVFVLTNDELFGSERDLADVKQMLSNASDIWNQADINLELDKVIFLDMSDADIGRLLNNPNNVVHTLDDYDSARINVFLTRTLKGIQGVNGIAFIGIKSIAIADFTTVYDFRILAHEIGHILGLGHVEEDNVRLMYSGTNGFDLTIDEVLQAREEAYRLSSGSN